MLVFSFLPFSLRASLQ